MSRREFVCASMFLTDVSLRCRLLICLVDSVFGSEVLNYSWEGRSIANE